LQEVAQLEVQDQPQQAPTTPPAPRRRRRDPGVLASLQSIAVTVVIAVFVITFLVQAFQIPSESMESTLLIGDYLLVDKTHYAEGGFWGEVLPYSSIQRGDIIVFKYPVSPSQHFVKRVIGIPGDRIQIRNKRVFVNGEPLQENYVRFTPGHSTPFGDNFPSLRPDMQVDAAWWKQLRLLTDERQLIVPYGNYFVMGDNRDQSLDSRYWGFVPRENIVGRPLLIYWSMDSPDWSTVDAAADGKLLRFAYTLAHLKQNARWERFFRIVH
jgi:signal peptidase I